jgi:LysR family glycine cleavage system transcriptional activator
MSFAQAAAELNVTPAALSFQIKSLEEHLGTPLFRRLNRAVELTDAGHALAPEAQTAFEVLATGWRAALRTQDHQSLIITAGPAFTAKWLAPRLYAFAQTHPEIELRFSAALRIMDFNRDNVDVAIRFGVGKDEGLFARPLANEWLVPAMLPEMAKTMRTPADLADATLIIDQSIEFLKPRADWQAWFDAMGTDVTPAPGPSFSQADHAIDAALAGLGVVLARRSLVIKDLAEGRLVAPFPYALPVNGRFRFLCHKGAEERPQIDAFKNWMLQEIQKPAHIATDMNMLEPSAQ